MKVNYGKLFYQHFYIRIDLVDAIVFSIWLTFWPKKTLKKYQFMIECVSDADIETQMLAVNQPFLLNPGFEYDFHEDVQNYIFENRGIWDRTWLARSKTTTENIQLKLAAAGVVVPLAVRHPKTAAYYKMVEVLDK